MKININPILKEKGLTKTILAERMQISRDSLYSILNGNPSLQSLYNLAKVLEVPVYRLLQPEDHVDYAIRYKGETYLIPANKIIELIDKGEATLIK